MPTAPSADELGAMEACREAARRYCHGIDRLDGERMKSAYWPDATDDHGSWVGNAHDFVDHCMTSHARWVFTLHTIFNHTVELDSSGVTARGEAYNISYLQADDGTMTIWFGRYLDVYEKRGDEWRILERVCVHEGNRVEPPGTPMAKDIGAFRQGSFDRPSSGRPIGP